MPRRKTVQPEPLERFYLPDGTDVKVIDESCWPVGRGQRSAREFAENRFNPIIEDLGRILEKSDGIEKVEAILASPTTFVRHIAEIGVFGEEGCDDTNARKHWYKKVNVCMRAFINALKVHQART